MDDVDYLVEDNTRDGLLIIGDGWNPWYNDAMMVQVGDKMQMLGMILVTGEEPNNRE